MSAKSIHANSSRESTQAFDLFLLAGSYSPCSASNWMRLGLVRRRLILQGHARMRRPSPLRDKDLLQRFPKSVAKVVDGQDQALAKNSMEFQLLSFPLP